MIKPYILVVTCDHPECEDYLYVKPAATEQEQRETLRSKGWLAYKFEGTNRHLCPGHRKNL